jgi:regulator of protease activity HflC (stomatin/prohibitin superfamily)
MKKFALLALVLLSLSACQRIQTGEVGLRVHFDKTIASEELQAGSLNQTLVGSVLVFPVRDVAVEVSDMTPIAQDNSTMKDFDLSVIYSINPAKVSDLYTGKSRSFHALDEGETYLMYQYIYQAARNAAYKAARAYPALEMNDNRVAMESTIRSTLAETLAAEKLADAISINQVLIRSIHPAQSVVESANELVRAKNAFAQKQVEVETAKQEALRIAALNENAKAIEYMNAQAQLKIAEGIANGKVSAIVVPYDFKGIVNVGNGKP